jgi:hypothetical protein
MSVPVLTAHGPDRPQRPRSRLLWACPDGVAPSHAQAPARSTVLEDLGSGPISPQDDRAAPPPADPNVQRGGRAGLGRVLQRGRAALAAARGSVRRLRPALVRASARVCRDDRGMSTVEYAIGTLAAAAFAAVLYAVVSGDSIVTALTGLVQRALQATF